MKNFLTLMVVFFCSVKSFAQKDTRIPKIIKNACENPTTARSAHRNTYTYTYNFKDLKKSEDCNVMPRHKKDQAYINIDNINTLVYDIDRSGVVFNLPLPDISLFDSLVNTLKAGGLNSSVETVDPPPASATSVKNQTKKSGKKMIVVSVNVPTPYYSEKQKIYAAQSYIASNFKIWVDDMKTLEYFLNFGKNVPPLVAGECCDQTRLETNILTDPNILKFAPDAYTPGAVNIATDYPNLLSRVGEFPQTAIKKIKDRLKMMKDKKKEADDLIAFIKKDCKEKKIRDIESACDVENLEDNYPSDFDKAVKAAEGIDEAVILKSATELKNLMIQVGIEQNFRYRMTVPYKIEGDTYDAKLKWKPKSQYANLAKMDSLEISFLVKGKFEWAIGPALNFHVSKSLFDQSFQIDSARNSSGIAKSDTFAIARNPTRNRLTPSVGVMAHFYWQRHAAFTPGIALGLSTSVADIKDLRAYVGMSFMLGGLGDKVFINTGYAFGWADRLKSNLREGENPKSQIPFTGEKIASPEQLVEKAFQGGLFFGVTYRLSN